MKPHHRFCLVISIILFAESVACSSLTKTPLGIPPQEISYFKSEIIKCKDGSRKFTKSQLNDDFCDCLDGTDEPGTSACPGGKFYCQNVGHAPFVIFSSRVNDGICDCCDGSDEYNGRTNCSNTCWEAGKVAREKLKKKIATYQEGVTIRNREIEQAKLGIAKDEAELSKLKNEEKILQKLVEQLKVHKEQIEKAEEKERLEKEKEEKKKSESEKKSDEQIEPSTEKEHGVESDEQIEFPVDGKHEESDNTIGTLHDSPLEQEEEKSSTQIKSHVEKEHEESDDKVGSLDDPPVEQHNDGSDSTEGLSKEELGRLVASRWTGETSEEKAKDIHGAKVDEHEKSPDMNADEEDADGYHSETDGENQKYDEHKYDEDEMDDEEVEDDFENDDHDDSSPSYNAGTDDQDEFSDLDSITTSSPSWLGKIQQTVRNILQSVNLFQTPIDKSDASRVRKEYDESSEKLSKIRSRISRLDEKLKQDYGMEKEFYSFHGRCFESKENKYVYKVCPFKQASQVEGHSTTQLGHWDKFEDSYKAMLFSNGDKCWNGPDRSLKVKLRCGLTNEITDVDEPSRCEYIALLSTPALCLEDRLKELQHKLDLMNSEQPHNHDEL